MALQKVLDASEWLEVSTSGVERWRLVAGTATATLAAVGLLDLLNNWREYGDGARKGMVRAIRSIPAVQRAVDKELSAISEDATKTIFKSYSSDTEGLVSLTRLPAKGWSVEEVEAMAKKVVALGDYNWKSGRISGGSFSGDNASYTSLMAEMFQTTVWTNPLHFDVFPGARKMDAEVVAMTKHLLNADEDCVGCVTSGGSESLMVMLKAYRDYSLKHRGVSKPEAVVARTVHAAIDKAAHYLGVRLRKVDIDPVTYKANVSQMKRAINSNTILLMASAPDFSYGIIDDVEAIAALGMLYSVPVHVDCCMGGFLLPFMGDAGYPLPPFDFRVKGVTSMSADNHKYGNAPKGSSVVVYRDRAYLHAQYFKLPNWPGGIYATPTVAGSRPGVNVAVCWAAMLYHGRSAYVDITAKIVRNARKLKEQIGTIPELQVMGDPLGGIISARSDDVDMLVLVGLLQQKGWHLITLQHPPGLQICMTQLHTSPTFVEQLMADLRTTVRHLRDHPDQQSMGLAKVYGMASQAPDQTLVVEAAKLYLDHYYDTTDL